MTFTVEDETGMEDSNAYVAVAFVDSYHSDRGNAGWTGSSTVKQQAIIKATDYVDTRYRGQFRGTLLEDAQALQFPRENCYDGDNILQEGIPVVLQKAIAEYALRALTATLLPDPAVSDTGQMVKMHKEVVGPIEDTTEYMQGAVSLMKPYPAADRLLSGLLKPSQGSVIRG